MTTRTSTATDEYGAPCYQGIVRFTFSAALRIAGLEPGHAAGRLHGHDFCVAFRFEATTLAYPGVVVDDDMREEITHHIRDRLDHRDLDGLMGRPATCEAIAEHLAGWYLRSARPPGHARLVSVTVTTGAGGHGEIHLPDARGGRR